MLSKIGEGFSLIVVDWIVGKKKAINLEKIAEVLHTHGVIAIIFEDPDIWVDARDDYPKSLKELGFRIVAFDGKKNFKMPKDMEADDTVHLPIHANGCVVSLVCEKTSRVSYFSALFPIVS